MRFISTLILSLLIFAADAQVGINILVPDSSAVLQLESDKKGLGLTRLTLQQRNAIQNPLRGLTIFNTTDSFVEYYTGECWLRAYERSCDDCDFRFNIDDPTDTLDRVFEDSVFSTISVQKLKGSQQINISFLTVPPPGVQVFFDGNSVIDSVGNLKIVVKADIFAGDGPVSIILLAFCGDQVRFLSYNVYIEPCVRVTVPISTRSYNLQARNPVQLPPGSRKCVVMTVNNSVEIGSDTSTNSAYTTGNLNPLSKVGIINNGFILGRGGNGGGFTFSGSLITVGGTNGAQGGDAMNLTTRTILQNNGAIYGGGGGGGSVGLLLQTPSLPLVGSIALGVGFGGGGGSELGRGGAVPSGALNIGIFSGGQSATGGVNSVPGNGAVGTTTIPINISVLTVNITPNARGGNGGGYGQQGQNGTLNVTIQACVQIPIIGSICTNIPIPGGLLPFVGPPGGFPGMAVRRNGNSLVNLPDGNYNSNQVKGLVGP
jgi:hypothetical protein